jgi:ABC-type glycerol-3-phosphate transport system permease component
LLLSRSIENSVVQVGLQMAASTLASLPILVIYHPAAAGDRTFMKSGLR